MISLISYLKYFPFCSLLSSSRDSTYREEETRNFIDELNTNGSSSNFHFNSNSNNIFIQTLSRNFKTQIPTHTQIRTQQQQQQKQQLLQPVQQQQQQQKQHTYSIKKSSSCSSFLYDILFRGICQWSKNSYFQFMFRFLIGL